MDKEQTNTFRHNSHISKKQSAGLSNHRVCQTGRPLRRGLLPLDRTRMKMAKVNRQTSSHPLRLSHRYYSPPLIIATANAHVLELYSTFKQANHAAYENTLTIHLFLQTISSPSVHSKQFNEIKHHLITTTHPHPPTYPKISKLGYLLLLQLQQKKNNKNQRMCFPSTPSHQCYHG